MLGSNTEGQGDFWWYKDWNTVQIDISLYQLLIRTQLDVKQLSAQLALTEQLEQMISIFYQGYIISMVVVLGEISY